MKWLLIIIILGHDPVVITEHMSSEAHCKAAAEYIDMHSHNRIFDVHCMPQ
jgi:PHD/YefM family antitoxin component YafN of YafNO toxin-antitoxin module